MGVKLIPDFVAKDTIKLTINNEATVENLSTAVFDIVLTSTENSTPVIDLSYAATAGSGKLAWDTSSDIPNKTVVITIPSSSTNISTGLYLAEIKRTIGTTVITLGRSGKDGVDPVKVFKSLN